MPKSRTDWIVVTFIVALIGAIWVGVTRVDASNTTGVLGENPAPAVGHPAPDFTLINANGEEVSLSDYRGQPVLVNFWATWCPPCRAEIPALEQVSRELDGEIVILGIDVDEHPARVIQFMREYDMTYPVLMDETAEVSRAYRVRAFPTSYFIDSNGIVVDIFTGPLNEPLLYTRLTKIAGR